ncbi:histidine kinase [Nostocales cyanobacterium HT-58-2]|nr:histidine kinase [Nostocales cyanobacterium HT-58-2]
MFKKINSKLNNLKLAKKLTLLLLLIFIGGIAFSGVALANILNYKAQDEISSKAWLMIRTLSSVRSYTSNEVTPQLETRLERDEFSPQVIPAYSARIVFENLKKDNKSYKDFIYKEAMLNPTNVNDKADSFETAIVKRFQQNKSLKELTGFRSLENGEYFYIARPLALTDSSCLKCHSTPDVAPKNMVEIYGTKNGFGWTLNLINGIQIISIPAAQVLQNARQSFVVVIGIVAIFFALAIFMANLWLKRYILGPIKRVVQVAEAVSTGDMDAEFEKVSNDEVASLVEAFTRMKLSLALAIKRVEQYRMKPRKPDN